MSNNSECTRGERQVSIGHSENACLLDMNHLYYTEPSVTQPVSARNLLRFFLSLLNRASSVRFIKQTFLT